MNVPFNREDCLIEVNFNVREVIFRALMTACVLDSRAA